MTTTEPTESQEITVSKDRLVTTANEMEQAAVAAAVAGQQEAALGVERLEAAGDLAAAGAVMMAKGASDITQAVDQKIVSERLAAISDVVAVAGVVDVAEGAEMLAASEDVGVMSALVGMMSEDDLEHGLELARISGELLTASELVDELRMPVLSAFLSDRSDRLHEMSLEQIHISISTKGISELLASSGTRIGALGENEVAEGLSRLEVAEAASAKSEAMAQASEKLAMQGIEEMIVGQEVGQVARMEAVEGAAEISAGSAVVGAAVAINDVANTLKEKSE
jgi:hypothetical protein